MANKKIIINVDSSDDNADWLKRVRDDRNRKAEEKEEELKNVDKAFDEELEEV